MGRVSFRLRRDSTIAGELVNAGSFTRGTPTWQGIAGVASNVQDNDRGIRSRNLVLAADVGGTSFFEAFAIEHTANILRWSLTETPTTVSAIAANGTGLIGIKVVYSLTGYPESANDGTTIYDENNVDPTERNIGIQEITHQNVSSGSWGYYSLFGRYYQDAGGNGSYWYEKLSSVETLSPTDYNSLKELWARIPQYYRDRDTSGDLYNFLDIFGFELDRTRSLIASVIAGYDPERAEAEGIGQLANLVGLEVGVADIGVTRTRALLRDIGFLRRRKGTVQSIEGYLSALSGAKATFTKPSSTWIATVYAQRANLIGDPRLVTSLGAATPTWGVTQQNAGAATVTQVTNGIQLVTGATATKVALISKVAVPISTDAGYYTSFGWLSTNAGAIPYGCQIASSAAWTTWTGTGWTAQPELPVSGLDYQETINSSTVTRRVFEVGNPSNQGTTKYPVLLFYIPANTTVTITRWMLEPYSFGAYFDGSSDFGGFLYQSNFNDYAWSGTINTSYSTFMVQRKKTQEAIKKVCSSIIPVNITFDPSSSGQLKFDWIPGKT